MRLDIVTLDEALAGMHGPTHAHATAALHLMDDLGQDWARAWDVMDRLSPPASLLTTDVAAWCRGELRPLRLVYAEDRHAVAS